MVDEYGIELEPIMRYEIQGVSCGLYARKVDGYDVGWAVVSTSTGKTFTDIVSFSQGMNIFHGCVGEIKSRIGYSA